MPTSLTAEMAEGRMNDLQVASFPFILQVDEDQQVDQKSGREDADVATSAWPKIFTDCAVAQSQQSQQEVNPCFNASTCGVF